MGVGALTDFRPLLARPITLHVRLDGKWQQAESATNDFSKVAPDCCDYASKTTVGKVLKRELVKEEEEGQAA